MYTHIYIYKCLCLEAHKSVRGAEKVREETRTELSRTQTESAEYEKSKTKVNKKNQKK